MYNDRIENSNTATHLGIARNVNGKPEIGEKINLGRKTAYSLMGAGLHGGGGLKPLQNGYIWSTFVVIEIEQCGKDILGLLELKRVTHMVNTNLP